MTIKIPVLNSELVQTFPSDLIRFTPEEIFSDLQMFLPGFVKFRLLGFVGVSAKRVVGFLIIYI